MILGSEAIIMDYSDARFIVEALRGPVISGSLTNKDQLDAYDNLQRAVREIESKKFEQD